MSLHPLHFEPFSPEQFNDPILFEEMGRDDEGDFPTLEKLSDLVLVAPAPRCWEKER